MRTILINVIAFQVGWFACILGAAHGLPLLGPAVVAILLGFHLFLMPDARRETRLLVTASLIGFALDSFQSALGVFSFAGSGMAAWVSPPWMIALWPNFATTLRTSLRWLAGRYSLAAVLGVVAGPLSYYAGAQLGALTLHPTLAVSLIAFAVVWGITLPILLWLAE